MNEIHVGMVRRVAGKKSLLVTGLVASAMVWVGAKAYADDATDIQQFYPVGSYVTYDNTSGDYPVLTAIGSMPTNIGGHVYSSWSVFAEDSTGSLDLFIASNALTSAQIGGSPPLNVGDKVNVAGQFGPYHQIPEVVFSTVAASNNYFHTVSTGNAVAARPVFTVSQLSGLLGGTPATTLSNNLNIAGYVIQINNVTITAPSNNVFTTNLPGWTNNISQETFTIADNTGSMTMFDWMTSYSSCTLLSNTPIGAANQYNATGFMSFNTGGPLEFTPLTLTAVPEPSTIALVGMAVAGLYTIRRRRR